MTKEDYLETVRHWAALDYAEGCVDDEDRRLCDEAERLVVELIEKHFAEKDAK